MPFTQLSRLSVPTAEGVDLVFTNVEVGVLDIIGVDGVLGMNILTSGYGDLIFGGGEPGEYGYFGNVIFDFTGGQWVMRLDANPDVVPEPATGMLVLLPALWLARRPRRVGRDAQIRGEGEVESRADRCPAHRCDGRHADVADRREGPVDGLEVAVGRVLDRVASRVGDATREHRHRLAV